MVLIIWRKKFVTNIEKCELPDNYPEDNRKKNERMGEEGMSSEKGFSLGRTESESIPNRSFGAGGLAEDLTSASLGVSLSYAGIWAVSTEGRQVLYRGVF